MSGVATVSGKGEGLALSCFALVAPRAVKFLEIIPRHLGLH